MGYSERETALLEGQLVGRLASVGRGGEIHLVPMCYAFDSKSIYTSTAVNSWKVRNLKAVPKPPSSLTSTLRIGVNCAV